MTETPTPSVEGGRLEAAAQIIYERAFERTDGQPKPPWVPRGNSLKQDAARDIARQIDALPCKGGGAVAWRWRAAGHEDAWCYTDVKARAYGFSNPDAWTVEPLFATPTTEPDTGRGLREALDGLARHRNWEVSYGYPDEEAEGEWQVHRVDGGRSDREWTLIGSGPTPAAALDQALAALSDTPRGREISEVETHRADAVAPASKGGA